MDCGNAKQQLSAVTSFFPNKVVRENLGGRGGAFSEFDWAQVRRRFRDASLFLKQKHFFCVLGVCFERKCVTFFVARSFRHVARGVVPS